MRENKIVQLTDIEHVRARPSMYVGACQAENYRNRWMIGEDGKYKQSDVTTIPALLKLFDEIISNSIDEGFRTNFKFANKIHVEFSAQSTSVTVTDNGRGIPLAQSLTNKKLTQADDAVTLLRAGANFAEDEEISIGTHGLGATLVNLLSDHFELFTTDGKAQLSLVYSDQMTKLRKREFGANTVTKKGSTSITWDFSRKAFPEGDEVWATGVAPLIEKRIRDLAALFPQITFSTPAGVVRSASFTDYAAQYGVGAQIYENSNFAVAVLAAESQQDASFVNGIDTFAGGTHVEYVRDQIIDGILNRLGKRQVKELGLKPQDLKNNLLFIIKINRLAKPKFDGQTKERIKNPDAEIKAAIGEIPDAFIRKLSKDDNIIVPILEYKKLKNDHKDNEQARKAGKKLVKLKIAEHIPANGPPEKCYLYLTEGKSACGKLGEVRDPLYHGSFPLRGKPMSTWGAKPVDILKNKEISELLSILGLQFGDGPETQLNYGHVRIMADADHDGHAIVSLLLALFSRWPWLFDQKRISVVHCPIMIVTLANGTKERIYSFERYEEFLKSGVKPKSVAYFKGLGSLSDDEYTDMVHNPVEDLIDKISIEDRESLELAFGEDADARKLWLAPSLSIAAE